VAREAAGPATVIPAGAARVALALLPVRALRIAAESAALLERLGLRRIGDLYKLPRPALVARFGLAVAERLDQALGELPEPLSPLPPAPLRSSQCRFAEPIAAPGDLAAAIGFLAEALARALETAGMGARRLVLRFHRVDGEVLRVAAGTAQASRDARHFVRLFLERLDGVEPGLGIEEMDLEAAAVEPLGDRQAGFAGEGDDGVTLAALIDRLENRLGAGTVGRLRPRDSHIPERAVARVPALAKGVGGQPWNPERPRPVRLLPRPEPIEAVAPVPDDPPVLFRWRRLVHRVRAADGPERILGEWWRDDFSAGEEGWRGGSSPADHEQLRDYYCVEDTDGRRFWLFRAGLHQPGLMPRWFLHGVFP
jgi:protein ImuB